MPEAGVTRAPDEVLFGAGIADAAGEMTRRLGDHVFVVTDRTVSSAEAGRRVLASLRAAGLAVEVFDGTVPELPMDVVLEAIRAAVASAPQCVVGLGGGSSIDLAKLVALGMTHGEDLRRFYGEDQIPGAIAPVVAIPTTAGTGSEVTPVAVLTDPDNVLKVGISSRRLIPTYALRDPTLTHGCPPAVTAHAGIDALAHAIEAFTAVRRPPPLGAAGVFVGKNSLFSTPSRRGDPQPSGPAPACRAARRAAGARGGRLRQPVRRYCVRHRRHGRRARPAVPVRCAHPHATRAGHGLLLAYAMRFDRPVRVAELAAVARAMGADTGADDEAAADAAIAAVAALAGALGIPASLAELSLAQEDLPELARQALGISRLMVNIPARPGRRSCSRFSTPPGAVSWRRGGEVTAAGTSGVRRRSGRAQPPAPPDPSGAPVKAGAAPGSGRSAATTGPGRRRSRSLEVSSTTNSITAVSAKITHIPTVKDPAASRRTPRRNGATADSV